MKTTDAKPELTTDVSARPAATAGVGTSTSTSTTEAKPSDATDPLGRLPFGAWGKRKGVSAADLRSAQILHHWPDGRILTEREFDVAVAAARNLVFR